MRTAGAHVQGPAKSTLIVKPHSTIMIWPVIVRIFAIPATILADTKRLRYAALAVGPLLLATVATQIYEIVAST